MGDFTEDDMLSYVTKLYMHEELPPIRCEEQAQTPNGLFTLGSLEVAIKKMASGKASDTLRLCAEMLEWCWGKVPCAHGRASGRPGVYTL